MERIFKTDDIQLAAFLLTQGIKLIEIEQDNPNHFIFNLSNPSKCIKLKQSFLNGASAPIRSVFSQREMLISEIKNRNNYRYGKS